MPSKSNCHGNQTKRSSGYLVLRLAAFVVLVIVVAGAAAWQLRPQSSGGSADLTVVVSMAGFQPTTFAVSANRPTTLLLKNPDSRFHTDGGGVHEFAVPDLGIDVLVDPKSSVVTTIPAAEPGTYTFYCDTCCGGKENPSMRGTIVVS